LVELTKHRYSGYNTPAMLVATDLKNNVTFLLDGKPCKVVKYAHMKVGRGGASVTVSYRNLESGKLEEKTFQSTAHFDEIQTYKRSLQYLYKDTELAYFMDPMSYEQVEIPLSILGDDIFYLKEGGDANILFWNEKALQADIPPKVTLKVTETDPGVKGNSATNIYKQAVLENGRDIKVPLFIKAGEQIKVDTRTGEYVERA